MYVMQNSNHTVFDYESYLGGVGGGVIWGGGGAMGDTKIVPIIESI
jgi:hypothetical protein